MVDTPVLGTGRVTPVEVRVLSPAPYKMTQVFGSFYMVLEGSKSGSVDEERRHRTKFILILVEHRREKGASPLSSLRHQ